MRQFGDQPAVDKNKKRMRFVIVWNSHQDFSPEFLNQHRDLVLYDIFHHIKAFLLFPLNCACGDHCQCEALREKIVLSLNMSLYNKAEEEVKDLACLYALKILLKIPEDYFFRKHYAEAYPVWLIDQEFTKREQENHFKIVNQLVWTLLRLAKTYQSLWGEPRASLNEAVTMILGKTPLKTKALKKDDYLCGEKAYGKYFSTYKSVSHFIVALEFVKEERQGSSLFSLSTPSQIERFLSVSHWFQKELMHLRTPNVKNQFLFLEESLCPLPSWVESDAINISLEPFEGKLQEFNAKVAEQLLVRQMA